MKAKLNLELAKEILKAAEEKLNKLYKDKDSGKLTNTEFCIRSAECAGLFHGLSLEANCLIQDSLGLPQSESKDSVFNQIAKMIEKDPKDSNPEDPMSLESLLKNRRGTN